MAGFPDLSDHLLALAYGCLLPYLSGVKGREAMEGVRLTERDRRRFYLANSVLLLSGAIPVLLSWVWHGRPYATLGFPGRFAGTAEGASLWLTVSGLMLLYSSDLLWNLRSLGRNRARSEELEARVPFLPKSAMDMPAYLVMCAAAAFAEEVVYRGFMVGYFMAGRGGDAGIPVTALLVPAVLFSLAHLYQGWLAVGKILLLSVLLGYIYFLSGSVWLVMTIHFTVDFVSGLACLSVIGREAGETGSMTPGEEESVGDGGGPEAS